MVSILLPAYNTDKFLKEAIESILNQTYKNFELILTDDSFSENILKIMQKYGKKFKV
jgi:glycosyltransferase involved in cell wall biosynthesis